MLTGSAVATEESELGRVSVCGTLAARATIAAISIAEVMVSITPQGYIPSIAASVSVSISVSPRAGAVRPSGSGITSLILPSTVRP